MAGSSVHVKYRLFWGIRRNLNHYILTGGQGQKILEGEGCQFFLPGELPPLNPIFFSPAVLLNFQTSVFDLIPVGKVNFKCATLNFFINGVLKVQNQAIRVFFISWHHENFGQKWKGGWQVFSRGGPFFEGGRCRPHLIAQTNILSCAKCNNRLVHLELFHKKNVSLKMYFVWNLFDEKVPNESIGCYIQLQTNQIPLMWRWRKILCHRKMFEMFKYLVFVFLTHVNCNTLAPS